MSKESQTEVVEKLVGSYDCKQGAVRAVRFNGNLIVKLPLVDCVAIKSLCLLIHRLS